MDSSSSEVKGTKHKSKRQRLDAPDAPPLTSTERDSILEKAARAFIRNRRSGSTKNQDAPMTQEYNNTPSNLSSGSNSSKKTTNKISPAFLITALEELRRFEEGEKNQQNMGYLEREIGHLQRGIVNRDTIIKNLRTELEEKNRILESLPRELVVNWVATQRMMTREQVDIDVLKTL